MKGERQSLSRLRGRAYNARRLGRVRLGLGWAAATPPQSVSGTPPPRRPQRRGDALNVQAEFLEVLWGLTGFLHSQSAQGQHEKKLTDLHREFLRELDEQGRSQHTIRHHQQTSKHIFNAGLTLDDFNSPSLLDRFEQTLPKTWARATTEIHLRNCASFGNWLARGHHTSRKHRGPSGTRRPRRREVMTEEETTALLESLRQRAQRAGFFRQIFERDYLIVWVLYETGVRVSEALDICVDDLITNEHGNYLTIRGTKTEASERALRISDALFINLTKYRAAHAIARGRFFRTQTGCHVDRTTFGKWLTKYCRELGIHCHVTPHLFRYQFIMRKVIEGMSALELMTRLGHGGVDMTIYYFNQVRRLMPWVRTNPDIAILERRVNYWRKQERMKGGQD